MLISNMQKFLYSGFCGTTRLNKIIKRKWFLLILLVKVKDNTGVKKAKCLRIYGKRVGLIGDLVFSCYTPRAPKEENKKGW